MTRLDPITRQLAEVHREFAGNYQGEVASYIPELRRANPAHFGIALVSLGGQTYQAGDADQVFTMQSVSKPFVYSLALAENGLDAVLDRVGVEPSGEAFNAISLEPDTGRPANPMINAGAILTTSLIPAENPIHRMEKILSTLSAFAGRRLDIDEAVYQSELMTGDRNRALAYLMKNAGALQEDVTETLDVYFRFCSVQVTAVDIAVMSATLANRGTNPVTGQQVVDPAVAGHVLTVMSTCGMYEYSGRWLVHAGLPAKSGVSGALVASSPGQFGLGRYSPPLDEQGNSVRGVAACNALSKRFDLQMFHRPGRPVSAMYTVDLADSVNGRSAETFAGDATIPIVRGLEGDISFADAEAMLRSFHKVLDADTEPRRIVLDLHRVGTAHRSATAILEALVSDLRAAGHEVVVVDSPGRNLVSSVDPVATLALALQRP